LERSNLSALAVVPPVLDLDWVGAYGGTGHDVVHAVAIGPDGARYLAGHTSSADLPATAGAVATAKRGVFDAFVAKLDADGAIEYLTYLGGSGGFEAATAIEVEPDGAVVVGGITDAADFPTTGAAAQTVYGGGRFDGFVARLSPTGSSLEFATYLGGTGDDAVSALALTDTGVLAAGATGGGAFPTTAGAAFPARALEDALDGFVAKIAPDGRSLVYATYVGGMGDDTVNGLAADTEGAAYVTGRTGGAAGFPVSEWAAQRTFGGDATDAFVVKLAADGASVVYGTYLGGSGAEVGHTIVVGTDGTAYVAGQTTGGLMPITTPGVFQSEIGGDLDAFVARLDPFGARVVFFTYLGGSGRDIATDILVGPDKSAMVAGWTRSTDLPTTPGARQRTLAGDCALSLCPDAFVSTVSGLGEALLQSTYAGGARDDRASALALGADGTALLGGLTTSTDWLTLPAAPFYYPDGLAVQLRPPGVSEGFQVSSVLDVADAVPGDGQCAAPGGAGCTLRAAVMEANILAGRQTIQLPAATYQLTIPPMLEADDATGDLDIRSEIEIVGAGADTVSIVGIVEGEGDRLIEIAPEGNASLRGLTLRGGRAGFGGGIRAFGPLRIEDCTVAGNEASYGGGISTASALTVTRSVITGNDAGYGGGIDAAGESDLTLVDSVVSDNAHGYGAGFRSSGKLDVARTVITGNSGGFGGGVSLAGDQRQVIRASLIEGNDANRGGGLSNDGSNAWIENTTITGNSGTGGAIQNGGTLTVTYSTVAYGTSDFGAGVLRNMGTFFVGSSILGPAIRGEVCDSYDGAIVSLGHNIDRDGSCRLLAEGDHTATDPLLAPLEDLGGPTRVHPLREGSPARNAGDPDTCPATDQRGAPRPFGDACDIGAVEMGAAAPAVRRE
jgi:hypothetical protein